MGVGEWDGSESERARAGASGWGEGEGSREWGKWVGSGNGME